MKKSDYQQFKGDFAAMRPTPRHGVLDELKKAHVILLVASGLSRRETAGYVQCAHTTIGRTAARDPDFAAKLCQAEATAHVKNVTAIRAAAQDPKYWRAAAWMLERRSPEEYARRDPRAFTADQVMSLLARLYSESLPLLPAEKVQQFQELFDEALDEVEAKSCAADREEGQGRTRLASRYGLAEQNGPPPGKNGKADVRAAAPSSNGCRRLAPEGNGAGVPADACGEGSPVPGTQYTVTAASSNGKAHAHVECQEPLAERAGHAAQHELHAEPGEYAGPEPNAESETPSAAARLGGRMTAPGQGVRRFDPAQLHQPLHQWAGTPARGDDRKGLAVNDLQHQSTDCTTIEEVKGRCNKSLVQPAAG